MKIKEIFYYTPKNAIKKTTKKTKYLETFQIQFFVLTKVDTGEGSFGKKLRSYTSPRPTERVEAPEGGYSYWSYSHHYTGTLMTIST